MPDKLFTNVLISEATKFEGQETETTFGRSESGLRDHTAKPLGQFSGPDSSNHINSITAVETGPRLGSADPVGHKVVIGVQNGRNGVGELMAHMREKFPEAKFTGAGSSEGYITIRVNDPHDITKVIDRLQEPTGRARTGAFQESEIGGIKNKIVTDLKLDPVKAGIAPAPVVPKVEPVVKPAAAASASVSPTAPQAGPAAPVEGPLVSAKISQVYSIDPDTASGYGIRMDRDYHNYDVNFRPDASEHIGTINEYSRATTDVARGVNTYEPAVVIKPHGYMAKPLPKSPGWNATPEAVTATEKANAEAQKVYEAETAKADHNSRQISQKLTEAGIEHTFNKANSEITVEGHNAAQLAPKLEKLGLITPEASNAVTSNKDLTTRVTPSSPASEETLARAKAVQEQRAKVNGGTEPGTGMKMGKRNGGFVDLSPREQVIDNKPTAPASGQQEQQQQQQQSRIIGNQAQRDAQAQQLKELNARNPGTATQTDPAASKPNPITPSTVEPTATASTNAASSSGQSTSTTKTPASTSSVSQNQPAVGTTPITQTPAATASANPVNGTTAPQAQGSASPSTSTTSSTSTVSSPGNTAATPTATSQTNPGISAQTTTPKVESQTPTPTPKTPAPVGSGTPESGHTAPPAESKTPNVPSSEAKQATARGPSTGAGNVVAGTVNSAIALANGDKLRAGGGMAQTALGYVAEVVKSEKVAGKANILAATVGASVEAYSEYKQTGDKADAALAGGKSLVTTAAVVTAVKVAPVVTGYITKTALTTAGAETAVAVAGGTAAAGVVGETVTALTGPVGLVGMAAIGVMKHTVDESKKDVSAMTDMVNNAGSTTDMKTKTGPVVTDPTVKDANGKALPEPPKFATGLPYITGTSNRELAAMTQMNPKEAGALSSNPEYAKLGVRNFQDPDYQKQQLAVSKEKVDNIESRNWLQRATSGPVFDKIHMSTPDFVKLEQQNEHLTAQTQQLQYKQQFDSWIKEQNGTAKPQEAGATRSQAASAPGQVIQNGTQPKAANASAEAGKSTQAAQPNADNQAKVVKEDPARAALEEARKKDPKLSLNAGTDNKIHPDGFPPPGGAPNVAANARAAAGPSLA